jgi:alpha-N-arabinofuranosidase
MPLAAKDTSGKVWLEVANLDPELAFPGMVVKSAKGETLTAPDVDSVRTIEATKTVVPKPVSATAQDGRLTLKVEPKSTVVLREP